MKRLTIAVLLVLVTSFPAFSRNNPDSVIVDIESHNIAVKLDPETHMIQAADLIGLNMPCSGEFIFSLNRGLTINSIYSANVPIEFEILPFEGDPALEIADEELFMNVKAVLPEGTESFTVDYSGEIYDPIDPSSALGRVRGDYTTGIISTEGVYLSSSSGWYPDTEYSMATYNLEILLPENWQAVTQGYLQGRETGSFFGMNREVWISDVPSDGLVLVANQYFIRTRTIGGIECSTYLYSDDEELSSQFLDMLEEYVPAYQEMLGEYPYTRFDIVENFFTTGYGMPGFTLLGSRVLRMPYATAEGSLAHELVHNWWGNYVYVDWPDGNWCEGLTFFCTNYFWSILDDRPEDAEHLRFRAMVRYSVEVDEDTDYPVREFWTKMTSVDGDIGYDKSSFIFLMLKEMIGDEEFFEALHIVVERHGGTITNWNDFIAAFEDVTGRDLGNFFDGWLETEGAPQLSIKNVSQTEVENGWQVTFDVVQEPGYHVFRLPVCISFGDGEITEFVSDVAGSVMHMEILLGERASRIELDPHHTIYRKLTRDEIPPSLAQTLAADSVLVILPGSGEDVMVPSMGGMMGGHGHGGMGAGAPDEVSLKEHYESLGQSIMETYEGVTVMYDSEVTESDMENTSVICLGSPLYNSAVTYLLSETDQFDADENGFAANGIEYASEGYSILVTQRNPLNDDYDVTFYMGTSPDAVTRASMMFFYGWDSFVVYQNGSPVDRGEWEMSRNGMVFEF